MSHRSAHCRAERLPDAPCPERIEDPEVLQAYLQDASARPPGRARGLVRPESEAEAAAFLRATLPQAVPVLPQAGRTSLTGGAVPEGEVILSVERLRRMGEPSGGRVRVGAGVRLRELQEALRERGFDYPPVPTYLEARVGGTVATNAGGAATFKYGVTRDWVEGLRVLLFNGDLLELERGQVLARPGETFRIELSDGSLLQVPVPTYRLPPLKKISAGYYAADPLDLVDLFVGSEGTLGLVAEVTLRLIPAPPGQCTGLAFLADENRAYRLAGALRHAAQAGWSQRDRRAPDVRAIEFVDRHGLELLRRSGAASRLRVPVPATAGAAVLFEMELPQAVTADRATTILADWIEGRAVPDGPLVRLATILREHEAFESLELAFPGELARAEALREFREAVPKQVNEWLSRQAAREPAVRKVGGDLIVPFEAVGEMLAIYHREFDSRGLGHAVWGHLSDGNLHPNALPADARQVAAAEEAMHVFAEEAIRRGGCPLSEHGVGRSPLKQALLRRFHGEAALEQMRALKRALDPAGRLAPGVLLPPPR